MCSWQMRSSSSVVTPGFTCGATTCRTSSDRRPASRIFSISSGVLRWLVIAAFSPLAASGGTREAARPGPGGTAGGQGVSAVADIGRRGLLHVHDVLVADAVQLIGGHPRLHVRGDHLQDLGGQAAGLAHLLDFFGGLEVDGHRGIIADCGVGLDTGGGQDRARVESGWPREGSGWPAPEDMGPVYAGWPSRL